MHANQFKSNSLKSDDDYQEEGGGEKICQKINMLMTKNDADEAANRSIVCSREVLHERGAQQTLSSRNFHRSSPGRLIASLSSVCPSVFVCGCNTC